MVTITDQGKFVCIPLRADGSKKPAIGGWNTPDYIPPAADDPIWSHGPRAVHAGLSGLIILDVDVKHGKDGFASLKDREALPPTYSVETPSGGRHYYFRAPEGFEGAPSVDKVGRGLDIRAGNSYVAEYAAPETPAAIAPAPAWLIPYARKRAKSDRQAPAAGGGHPAGIKALLDRIDLSARQVDYLTWIKCLSAIKFELGDAGFDMAVDWSLTYPDCDPSDVEARWDGLGVSGDAVARGTLIQLAGKDGADIYRQAVSAAAAEARAKLAEMAETRIKSQIDAACRAHAAALAEGATPAEADERALKIAAPTMSDAERRAELAPAPALKPGYLSPRLRRVRRTGIGAPDAALIEDYLGFGEVAMLFGASGAGKSFAAIDIAMSVAHGVPFHGKGVEKGAAVYFVGEGSVEATDRRSMAWGLRHKRPAECDDDLIIAEGIPNLTDAADVAAWIDLEIKPALAELPEPPVLLIFDTLAAASSGADENSAQTATALLANAKLLRALCGPKTTVLLVHHSGLAETNRARGSSAFFAGMDRVIRLSSIDGTPGETLRTVMLEFVKVKDAERPAPLRLTAVREATGLNRHGEEVFTPVLVSAAPDPVDRLGKLAVAHELWRLFEEMEPDRPVDAAGRQVVSADALRAAFFGAEKYEGARSGTVRTYYNRAWGKCVEAGLLAVETDEKGALVDFYRARPAAADARATLAAMREAS